MRVWTDKKVRDLFMGINVASSNDRSDAEMKQFDRWLVAHDKRVVRKTEQRIIKLLDDWKCGHPRCDGDKTEVCYPKHYLIELIKGETNG